MLIKEEINAQWQRADSCEQPSDIIIFTPCCCPRTILIIVQWRKKNYPVPKNSTNNSVGHLLMTIVFTQARSELGLLVK